LPGPVCTHLLTRLGATVTKIEGKGSGQADYVRDLPPQIRVGLDRKHGAMFEALHAGKQGLSLDLKHKDGAEVLKKLVRSFDVVVEGNRPGVMERLGVGFEDLRRENPALVYCSLTGYGQDGPWSQRAGHDVNYMALSGLLGLTGKADELPPTVGFQAADAAGAMQAVVGILAALVERGSTGLGQSVDVSLTEAVMTLGLPSLVHSLVGYQSPRGGDTLNGGLPNYRTYRTQDEQYLSVGALEGHFWARLCDAAGRPDLSKIAPTEDVEAMFASRTRAQWEELFGAVDACVEPVFTAEEALAHPQHSARSVVLEEAAPAPGASRPRRQLVLGPRMSLHPAALLPPAPRIGEHTSAILRGAGFDEADIAALHASGAVYCLDLDQEVAPPAAAAAAGSVAMPTGFTQAAPYRIALEAGKEYWWCRCGQSANQPFCDGAHERLGTGLGPELVTVDEDRQFSFCGCRLSEKGARCDGAHKKLKQQMVDAGMKL
jgi:alpha-methylacyl-CoA racemase